MNAGVTRFAATFAVCATLTACRSAARSVADPATTATEASAMSTMASTPSPTSLAGAAIPPDRNERNDRDDRPLLTMAYWTYGPADYWRPRDLPSVSVYPDGTVVRVALDANVNDGVRSLQYETFTISHTELLEWGQPQLSNSPVPPTHVARVRTKPPSRAMRVDPCLRSSCRRSGSDALAMAKIANIG